MWIGLCLQWCACPRLKCIEFLEIEILQGLKWNLGTWLAVWAVPVTVGHTTAMAHVETRPAMNLCRKRRFWVLTASGIAVDKSDKLRHYWVVGNWNLTWQLGWYQVLWMMTMSRGICLRPAAIVFDQSPQLLVSVQTWSQDPCLNVKFCPNVSFGKVECILYTVYCE